MSLTLVEKRLVVNGTCIGGGCSHTALLGYAPKPSNSSARAKGNGSPRSWMAKWVSAVAPTAACPPACILHPAALSLVLHPKPRSPVPQPRLELSRVLPLARPRAAPTCSSACCKQSPQPTWASSTGKGKILKHSSASCQTSICSQARFHR